MTDFNPTYSSFAEGDASLTALRNTQLLNAKAFTLNRVAQESAGHPAEPHIKDVNIQARYAAMGNAPGVVKTEMTVHFTYEDAPGLSDGTIEPVQVSAQEANIVIGTGSPQIMWSAPTVENPPWGHHTPGVQSGAGTAAGESCEAEGEDGKFNPEEYEREEKEDGEVSEDEYDSMEVEYLSEETKE